MSWRVQATCDGCGKGSEISARRSFLAAKLARVGWVKGGRPGEMFCPACVGEAMERRKLREKGAA